MRLTLVLLAILVVAVGCGQDLRSPMPESPYHEEQVREIRGEVHAIDLARDPVESALEATILADSAPHKFPRTHPEVRSKSILGALARINATLTDESRERWLAYVKMMKRRADLVEKLSLTGADVSDLTPRTESGLVALALAHALVARPQ